MSEFFVGLLCDGDVGEVVEANGVDPAEGVGDNVVRAADMPDVGGELADVVEISDRLLRCIVMRSNEGEGQWLVVGEDCELPAFDLRSKVLDSLLDG